MKKQFFYLITAISFLLTSCTKEDLNMDNWSGGFGGGGGAYISGVSFYDPALAIINIQTYRNFSYKDQATGSIDTITVTQSLLDAVLQPAVPGANGWIYNTYSLSMEKIVGATNQPWFKGFAACDLQAGTGPINNYIDSNFSLINEQTNLPAFWYPFISSSQKQFQFIPTLNVEGRNYSSVHKFSASNGLPPSDINYTATSFYWVKGIGIIKKEISTFNTVKTSSLTYYW